MKKITIGELLSLMDPKQKLFVSFFDGESKDIVLFEGTNPPAGQDWQSETFFWIDARDNTLYIDL